MAKNAFPMPTCLSVHPTKRETPGGTVVTRQDDEFYRIDDYDSMAPFLVSLTSPSDHWMFLSTSGGITAGRKNADHAIFPYATGDRVADSATTTGGVTILLVPYGEKTLRWEPFVAAHDSIYQLRRSVEKNATGNIITFEEHNLDLGLTFRQTWTNSAEYGIVRQCSLLSDHEKKRTVVVLDGVRNTLPALATAAFQASFSNLLDAYKRSEALSGSGIGVFALSAVPTDAAEPSEALGATTWWQDGLEPDAILLSTNQLQRFREGADVETERDVKGRRGAYIVVSRVTVGNEADPSWVFCGEVDQTHADVVALDVELRRSASDARDRVAKSIADSTARLREILSTNDGIQETGNRMTRLHHAANVTYNVMRGGYFAYGYDIPIGDFRSFVSRRNRSVAAVNDRFLASLPDRIRVDELQRQADATGDPNMRRLVLEYLPLTFSRRHGDPSRPWNVFSIENQEPDGSPRLAYQGNWRDIFQNWEALLCSSPLFVPNVVSKFLNATTIDGYNPYRITDDGIDWERPDPDSPWANIGYWGDHQIVYLLKLLEMSEDYLPGTLHDMLTQRIFSFADVPYTIATFDRMLEDPYHTIAFDGERDRAASQRCDTVGSDGKLLHGPDDSIVLTTMLEKLTILSLAKASSFVPDGGIWMNTQRPEWNDANNALVGKGVSVVTTAYLQRYASFVRQLLEESDVSEVTFFEETSAWVHDILAILDSVESSRKGEWTAASRLEFMRRCGNAADSFRGKVRTNGLSLGKAGVSIDTLSDLFARIDSFAADILERNRRPDELFHSYNTIVVERNSRGEAVGIAVLPLYEMLEGQVAAISSTAVEPAQAARTLQALRSSALYREDQHSYMLYPNRELRGFMARNVVSAERAEASSAIRKLSEDPHQTLITRDVEGRFHFDSSFRNATVLKQACADYREANPESGLVDADVAELLQLYEDTFEHQYFTGRSGTFFGYEGLGSVYWHMVSKLLLAAQENAIKARLAGDHSLAEALKARYFDVRRGIGFNKEPSEYGAFPTDPYSHTPFTGGAKQPGMTGQVKEEIIARFAELGLLISEEQMVFDPFLIEKDEFLREPGRLAYIDVHGASREIGVDAGAFAFTFCQTPIILSKMPGKARIVIHHRDGREETIEALHCSRETSRAVFGKTGEIELLEVVVATQSVDDASVNP